MSETTDDIDRYALQALEEDSIWDDSYSPETAVWETKDGVKMNVCDMTNAHIVHAISYILREGYYLSPERFENLEVLVVEARKRKLNIII